MGEPFLVCQHIIGGMCCPFLLTLIAAAITKDITDTFEAMLEVKQIYPYCFHVLTLHCYRY